MSGNLLTYSGIITKVKAMESHLLKDEDFSYISNLETTVDFITYLKKQPAYEQVFEHTDEHALHRSQIEEILANSMYLAYEKIYRFSGIKQREALSFIFFRYEVNILKSFLQRVFNQETPYDLSLFEHFFSTHSKLNVAQIATAHTLDEFILHLKGTEYYNLFKNLHNSNHENLYDYEAQLDIYYFTRVWKQQRKLLSGDDLDAFSSIMGSQIDILNILWIYRSKKFYDIDSTQLYSKVIPVNYKLSQGELMKLIESQTLDDFSKNISSTYYHKVFHEFDASTIEKKYNTLLTKVYITNSRKYPLSMTPIQYFLFQKERELDRLTTALECIRYKLESNEILNYISL